MTTGLHSRVVLLVEDDADLREVMCEAFEMKGIAHALASNGAEAIGYLRNAPAPALILLDLMMPVMDGATFRHEQLLVPAWRDIPVIILSADRDLDLKTKQLGVVGYVRKPADLFELIELIEPYLASPDLEPSHGPPAAPQQP